MATPVNISSTNDLQILREAIDAAIGQGDDVGARALLGGLETGPLDAGLASFIISRFAKLTLAVPLRPFKLAVLRSFTIEPIVPILRAIGLLAGLEVEVRVGAFNAYSQELLDPASWLAGFAPDAVLLAVQGRDFAPRLWANFTELDESQVQREAAQSLESYRQLIASYRGRHPTPIVMHNFQLPAVPSNGVFDAQQMHGQVATFAQMNRELAQFAGQFRNVYVLDYDGLVRRRGENAFGDPIKWATSRMPIAAGEWIYLAREWLRFLCPLSGRVCKVLAVDLDNTLWGGVVGEDGFDGIQLDDQYPGVAYRDVQRAMLDLHRRGIILAICSKNNRVEATEAIDRHPGMLLRREHFAAMRINWADKTQNLREIATELNVGLDSIAFLDDNPVEREAVRRQLPEVKVIELPRDPMEVAKAVHQSPYFERLEFSSEDRDRGRFYAEQRERVGLRQSTTSLEDFYRSLAMRVEIEPLSSTTLKRAAQLTQKTNQFNLTTRRYTEERLAQLTAPRWRAFTLRAQDRFGDSGLVGFAILKFEAHWVEIDTFLLSCRVIGRTIETAFLAALAKVAADRGAAKLVGGYAPTPKNEPAGDFYPSHGFIRVGDDQGESRWELPLPARSLTCPDWIDCHVVSREDVIP